MIPDALRSVVVTRQDYATGNAYLTLTAAGDRRWDSTFSRLKSG